MRLSVLVGALYGLIAIIFLVANSVILGMFGYKFGHGEWGKLLFAVVAASVPWALAPHLHVMAAKRRQVGRRRWFAGALGCIPFLIVYIVFVAYNLLGGTGATAFARTEQADERKHVIGETSRLESQRKALQSQYDAIPKARPKGTVEALISKSKLHPFWKATSECTAEITNKGRRNFCAELETLSGELASTIKADQLLASITDIDTKLSDHKRVVSDEDPQVHFLAAMTGFSKDQVMIILLLATPMLLEIGALYWGAQALQLLGWHIDLPGYTPPVVPPSRRLPPPGRASGMVSSGDVVTLQPVEISGRLQGDPAMQREIYERFWAERTRPMPGMREAASAIYSAYRSYCSLPQNAVTPFDFDTFSRMSAERVANTSTVGGVTYWLGVTIAMPLSATA